MHEIDRETITTDAGTFRVTYYPDEDPMSPRNADNVSVIVLDRHHMRGGIELDEADDPVVGEVISRVNEGRMSEAGACRYLRQHLGAWHVLALHVFDDWAPYVEASDGTDTGLGGSVEGFVFDTPGRRAVMIGNHEVGRDDVLTWLHQDMEAFSRYTSGEYVLYLIERLDDPFGDADEDDADATWTIVDSLSSIDSLEYAREEARETVRAQHAADFPSPVLAAQV